ncbi:hypothetical protein BDZ97DRAFT_1665778 [Flammula alnicola]|nr:hypothetical protein BDZ97DRAFT_1665778 [Flammula alnicola]
MILLTVLYLSASWATNTHALPSNQPQFVEDDTLLIYHRQLDIFTNRSIYHIIWSCFSTIFACTWIAVHPNVPAPNDRPWHVFGRRLAIMGYLLIVPEMVILWASRQYFGARKIAKRHKGRGWTKTHAFFLIMGGFSLHQDGVFLRTLDVTELEELAESGKVDWPNIREEEIDDRSKGDFLSKSVVILQTSWFIAQCITRGVNRLVVTELEVVTLAFAALTGIIYFLWWNKPLDIRCTVPVHLKDKLIDEEIQAPSGLGTYVSEKLEAGRLSPIPIPLTNRITPSPSPTSALPSSIASPLPHSRYTLNRLKIYICRQCMKHGRFLGIAYIILIRPFELFFSPIGDMLQCTSLATDRSRVPTFYSPDIGDSDTLGYLIAILVSIVFGGIHCIAWSFQFPTYTERWIWRVTAVIVSALPISTSVLSVILSDMDDESPHAPKWLVFMSALTTAFLMASTIIYMAARIALLVLPIISLRSLPHGAYVDINWTVFFPHFN